MNLHNLFESINLRTNFNIGDPVIITGNVEFRGKTGDVKAFNQDGSFVVVDLYNYGPRSFHISDVSYNDYADGDDDEGVAEGTSAELKQLIQQYEDHVENVYGMVPGARQRREIAARDALEARIEAMPGGKSALEKWARAYNDGMDEGVAEGGILKSIKRGLQGWSGDADLAITGKRNKPKDVVQRTKGYDTDTLKSLSKNSTPAKGSPAALQQKVISRELKKREQGVAESYDLDAFPGIKFLNPKTGKMGSFYYWSSVEGKNEALSMITNKKLVAAHDDGTPMTWDEYKQALDDGYRGVAEGSLDEINFQNRSTSNSGTGELRGVNIPSTMRHPGWKEPTWSFQEIAQMLGISTSALNLLAFKSIGGFPEAVPGLSARHGSKKYYKQSEVKRWVNANNVREKLKPGVAEEKAERAERNDQPWVDPKLKRRMDYAFGHYAGYRDRPEAFFKWIMNSIDHSEQTDQQHDERFERIEREIEQLSQRLNQINEQHGSAVANRFSQRLAERFAADHPTADPTRSLFVESRAAKRAAIREIFARQG